MRSILVCRKPPACPRFAAWRLRKLFLFLSLKALAKPRVFAQWCYRWGPKIFEFGRLLAEKIKIEDRQVKLEKYLSLETELLCGALNALNTIFFAIYSHYESLWPLEEGYKQYLKYLTRFWIFLPLQVGPPQIDHCASPLYRNILKI